jgi:hypothetical protein
MPGFCFLPVTFGRTGILFRVFTETVMEYRAGATTVAMRLSLSVADAGFEETASAIASGRVVVLRRLPSFDEQKKTRLRSHLSA